jgi:hypothetical protein
VSHPAVKHPVHLRVQRDQGGAGPVVRVNDWAATHLAAVFGVAWTIWVFLTVPLLVLLAPSGVKSVVFYLASGWIQLFSLPLMIYVGNKLQRSSDAQSEVIHTALTHIATVSDQCKTLIEQNTALTSEVHKITSELVAPRRSVT